MKRALSFIFLISTCLSGFSQSNFQFAFNPTDIPEVGEDVIGEEIKLDPSGNIYVVGNFRETADFDFGPSVANLSSISNNLDAFIAKYDPSGNFIYSKSIGGVGVDGATSIAIDALGNIYVTGYYSNTVDFDPSIGVFNLTSSGSYDVFIAKYDPAGNFLYAISAGGVNLEYCSSIIVDASNNTYVTGSFIGTVDFDPGAGVFNLISSGIEDAFVAKYDSFGNLVYALKIGGINYDSGFSMAVGASGNVFVVGGFMGSVDFDPGAGIANLSASGLDAFIANYDASGNHLSSFQIEGLGGSLASSIVMDASGIYLAGYYTGTADFNLSAGVANLTSAGSDDAFIAKYDFSGNYIYAKSMGGLDYDNATSIAIDGSGNAYITGSFKGVSDFDPGVAVFNLNSASPNYDVFYAKYDAFGNYVYAKNTQGSIYSGGGQVGAYSIAVDNIGNAYITGTFFSLLDFDPGPAVKNICTVDLNNDAFISKYDNNGDYLWTGSIGGYGGPTKLTWVSGIQRDLAGNIYVAGYFKNRVDFDPGPGLAILNSYGSQDIFIAKYDSLGNYIYAKRIGGVSGDECKSVAVDTAGNVYVTGFFSYEVDFAPGIGLLALSPSGGTFIAKYDPLGNYVYAKALGGSGVADAMAVVTDDIGNAYIAGRFNTTVDFDPDAGIANLTSAGSYDVFIAKYNSSGNYVYSKQIGGTGQEGCGAMTIDANNNVYVAGSFTNTVDFDPNAGVANLISGGSDDGYFAKYDSSGNYLYAKKIGSTYLDLCHSIAVDDNESVVVAGSFRGTVDFDPSAGVANITTTWYDFFFAKYDSLGNYVYAKNMDGTTGTMGKGAIGFDSDGNTFLTGYFVSTIDFDGGAGVVNVSSVGVSQDIYIAKYDSLGNYLNVNKIGGVGDDRSVSMIVNDSGMVWITGSFMSTVDFDPNSGVTNLQCPTGIDMFVAVYNNASDVVWPGDADNSNVVDNNDLLPIGLYYGQTGTPRATISNTWQAFNSTDWGGLQPSGADIKHVDCNGDGIIDNNDTLAVNLNFALTHAFAPINNEARLIAPDLYFVTSSSFYFSGNIVDVEVWLGNSTTPVTDLYGIAFNINYDASLVQPFTESLTYPASWLGAPGTDAITIAKIDAVGSTAYGAETRINQINSSGFGKIADFKFQIASSLPANTAMNFFFSGYMANDSSGTPVLFNTIANGIVINPSSVGLNEINNETQISIYPNPTNGSFNIFTSQQIKNGSLEIYNSMGELVLSQKIINQQNSIDFKNQASGLYFVKVISDGEVIGMKKVVKE